MIKIFSNRRDFRRKLSDLKVKADLQLRAHAESAADPGSKAVHHGGHGGKLEKTMSQKLTAEGRRGGAESRRGTHNA